MVSLPLLLLLGAAAGGALLWATRSGRPRLPGRQWVAPIHGLVATAGVVMLFLGPALPPNAQLGAWVLVGTVAGGLTVRWLQRTGRRPTADMVVFLHALGALLGVGLVLIASR